MAKGYLPHLDEGVEPSPLIDYTGETEGYEGPLGPAVNLCPQWTLDWEKYWIEFKRIHGNCPIQVGDRIVFEDGWSYDAYNIGGPEFPPPEGVKLDALMVLYYTERRNAARQQYHAIKDLLEGLRLLQGSKSAPLQLQLLSWSKSVNAQGFEEYNPQLDTSEIDFRIDCKPGDENTRRDPRPPLVRNLQGRLDWLQKDLKCITEKLKTLKDKLEGVSNNV